ncbi:MAG TPA: DUF4396 domain-containing protein, partial [Geodermatophilus sp.]|nr:DUF4396 domain-containing protein [Geodermatophilus sp.]
PVRHAAPRRAPGPAAEAGRPRTDVLTTTDIGSRASELEASDLIGGPQTRRSGTAAACPKAGISSAAFWLALAGSLAVAFVVTLPLNRWMMGRGKGHAVVHGLH